MVEKLVRQTAQQNLKSVAGQQARAEGKYAVALRQYTASPF